MAATHPVDSLLEHAEFLRRLAAQLAGGEADDLEQATWVRSVERPPARGDSPRGWLRTVATNLWRNERRAASRRAARERIVARAGEVPAVDDIAAREEVRQRVVAAVLTLPEPLREVVLLRYYEGLDSAAIGARLGRAPSTVRTQMQTALERLRARLDEQHHGDRAAWTVPLLGWMRALGEPMALTGSLVTLPIAALLVVLGLGLLWLTWPDSTPSPTERLERAVVAHANSDAATSTPDQPRAARQDGVLERIRPVAVDYTVEPRTGSVHGVARDAATLAPAGSVRIALAVVTQPSTTLAAAPIPRAANRQLTTHVDGTFAFDELPVGLYELVAETDDGRWQRRRVAVGESSVELDLALARSPFRGVVAVKVVDGDRRPVAGAEVALAALCTRRGPIGFDSVPPLTGVTDAGGMWLLRDRDRIEHVFEGVVTARTPDGRVGSCSIGRPEHRGENPYFEVTVGAPGRIVGRLRGPRADWTHVAVTAVQTWTYSGVRPQTMVGAFATEAAADGSFSFAALPAGDYFVQAEGLTGVRRVLETPSESWQFLPTAKVTAGSATAIEIEFAAAARVRGRVRSGALPIANAEVLVQRVRDGSEARFWRPPVAVPVDVFGTFRAVTDDAGEYEVTVPDGVWHVAATAAGFDVDIATVRIASAEAPAVLEHALVRDGSLRGRVAASSITLRPRGSVGAIATIVDVENDAFALRGLRPGDWEVFVSGREHDVPLASVTIRAGAETWLDLEAKVIGSVRGAAWIDGRPVEGLEVAIARHRSSRRVCTGPDGAFSLDLPVGAQAGDVRLEFAHRGFVCAKRQIAGASGDRELGIVELTARRRSFACVDADGRPTAATLTLGDSDLSTEASWNLADGRLDDQWISRASSVWLTVRFRDGTVVRQEVADAPEPVVVRCMPSGSLAVRLLDADGVPRIGGLIAIAAWGRSQPAPTDGATFAAQRAQDGHFDYVTTDADGRAIARGLPAGPVLVYFAGDWIQYGYGPSASGARDLPPAERVLTIEANAATEIDLVLR